MTGVQTCALPISGLGVILSSDSTFSQYEGALNTVMSDNICFPAKLAHSHLKELNENPKVDRILMPYVVYEHNDDPKNTLNSFNCPVVSGYSDVIKSVINLKKPIDTPVINFAQPKALEKQITDYLKQLGVSKKTARKALREALYAQAVYAAEIKKQGWEILKNEETEAQKPNKGLTILLAGRPYHTDPLIQHKLSEMIANLGVNVISEDIARGNLFADFKDFNLEDLAAERNEAALASQDINEAYNCQPDTYLVKQWAYMNRILKAAQWAAEQGDEVHFVQMTSFGCGPDSFIQDEIRDIMKRHNKPFTLLKIDDVSNIGSLKLRVRSLIEGLKGVKEVKSEERRVKKQRSAAEGKANSTAEEIQHSTLNIQHLQQTKVFTKQDIHRKILAPFMTECHLRVDDRHTTILANEIEIEVSTPEAGLPLVVLVTEHLLLIVGIELEILELQVLEILQHHIAGLDALIHIAPERALGVGWAPAAVIEGLDAGTAHGVNTLVGARGNHASAKVLTIIIVCIIVDIGHETTHLLKGLNHIILILDYRLAVIHLIAA